MVLSRGCDVKLTGRYTREKSGPCTLTIRGRRAQECFGLVCEKTRAAGIDTASVKVKFGHYEDCIEFLMEPFLSWDQDQYAYYAYYAYNAYAYAY